MAESETAWAALVRWGKEWLAIGLGNPIGDLTRSAAEYRRVLSTKEPGPPLATPNADQKAYAEFIDRANVAGAKQLDLAVRHADAVAYEQKQLERLKKAYDEASTSAAELAKAGRLDPEVSKKQQEAVTAAAHAYRQQSDLVKELQKDEGKRIALLDSGPSGPLL